MPTVTQQNAGHFWGTSILKPTIVYRPRKEKVVTCKTSNVDGTTVIDLCLEFEPDDPRDDYSDD